MMYKRTMMRVLLVAVLFLMCGLASFADGIATVTVNTENDYEFGVDETGIVLTAKELANPSEWETTYTFDENGNVVVVEPEDVDLTDEFAGMLIVDAINVVTPTGEYTFDVSTDPDSPEVEEMLTNLINGVEEETDEHPNGERFERADELGITNGKMNLIEKLETVSEDESFNDEEWAEKSVKEIMKEAKNNKKNAK